MEELIATDLLAALESGKEAEMLPVAYVNPEDNCARCGAVLERKESRDESDPGINR